MTPDYVLCYDKPFSPCLSVLELGRAVSKGYLEALKTNSFVISSYCAESGLAGSSTSILKTLE